MYEHEQVNENEAKQLASELNAIFQKTSAKESTGIEDLFIKIGKKYINPKSDDETGGNTNTKKEDKANNNIKLKKKNEDGKGKKGCC